MSRIERYLNQLNEQQREAVLENEKPLLVLAGAGSGKTRVITTKIAYAIDVLKLQSWQILAVTFTNRAAKEMKDRVEEMLPDVDLSEMHIRTFHSFGAWLLRRYGESIGLSNSFNIYDDEDSLSLLASIYPNQKKGDLKPVAKAISLAKDRFLNPDSLELDAFRDDKEFRSQFTAYEKKLRSVGNVDFADLISRSIELLEKDRDVANRIQNRFKMILVDEYQDSNIAQFKLLKSLVGPNTFVCVVGDDDQSIYRFRGAEIENILSFPSVYPNTRTIKLEQNYRSTKQILDLASSVIANNKGRHPKKLWTKIEGGEAVKLVYLPDERSEALRIAMELRKRGSYDNAAVLYRTNAQSVAFETLFTQSGIPHKVIGALRFYEREEVKDALALLNLFLNRNDEVAFKRMINKPSRSIGDVSANKIINRANLDHIDLISAIKRCVELKELSAKTATSALSFATAFEKAETELTLGNGEMMMYLITETNLFNYYEEQDKLNKTDKVENLQTLVSSVSEYESGKEGLVMFLESLTLDPTTIGHKDPSKAGGVSLITMHNTKGLEFDTVFIAGLEDGIFPSRSCETEDDLEEERRIFYVALTRAKKELFLFTCSRRLLWGKINYQYPSRFLREIDKELVEIEGETKPSFVNNSYDTLERRRQKSSFGPTVRKGVGRHANIILTPVQKFEQKQEKKELAFELGNRVYHDEFGEGEVQKVRELSGKVIVDVRFSTGILRSFFTDSGKLEKLGSNW